MENTVLPSQALLEGVEPVHFYMGEGGRCPEDITFPSVMRTVMEYLGENLGCKTCRPNERGWGMGCSYAYFMGVSGLAFAMNWAPGFSEATYGMIKYLSPDPSEPFRRSLAAVGYGSDYLPHEAGEAAFREAIKASIYERRRPVIALGVVGPPEAAVLTGYEADGDVLVGSSFFQSMEPNTPVDSAGYFHRAGWFEQTPTLVLVGDKGPMPDQKAVLLDALRFGAQIMERSTLNEMPTGPAAYDAWAADLLRDDCFPADNEAMLRQRHEMHSFMVGQVAELRWYGSIWLNNMNERVHYRQVEPLLKAAGSQAAEHALMWEIWDLTGGISNPDAWRMLADPGIRRAVVDVIARSKQKYIETAGYVEEVLGL